MMPSSLFSFKVFFVLLRETFESAIVISILLSFLKQNFSTDAVSSAANPNAIKINAGVYRSLQIQVWLGAIIGLGICLLIGAVFIALFYLIGENYWTRYERVWEALFSVLSSLIISVMGMSLLRISQMQKKWQAKLSKEMAKQFESDNGALDLNEDRIIDDELGLDRRRKPNGLKGYLRKYAEKYSLMVLPLVTLLREGLEAIFVITGVSASEPVSSLPLSIVSAFVLGSLIGVVLYKGGNKMRLQMFLIGSTCFLYLVSAGLMSRGVWFFELEAYVQKCHGQDMTEVGNGPGSYDVNNVIWHVNCCSGINDGGWMLLNALLGWNNTATWGSIISYNFYWIFVIIMLKAKLFQERNGYIAFIPIKWQLKKINKRYHIIKYNLEHNDTYQNNRVGYDSTEANEVELELASTRSGNGSNAHVIPDVTEFDIDETNIHVVSGDDSDATTALLPSSRDAHSKRS